VQLGRIRARPRCTVRSARVRARGASGGSARRRCPVSRRRLGTGARETMTGDGGGGRLRSRRRGFGPRRLGRKVSGRQWRARGDGRVARRRRGNAVGTRGHAVPTAALSRCAGAARGGHVAVARCHAGPARRTAAGMWGPLVSDFQIKNIPRRKLAQNN
jgi:hypothetical protein